MFYRKFSVFLMRINFTYYNKQKNYKYPLCRYMKRILAGDSRGHFLGKAYMCFPFLYASLFCLEFKKLSSIK